MKNVVLNYLFITVFAVVVGVAFTSCGGGSGSGGGKIKMTAEANSKLIFYLGGSGVATVDWGDGTEKVSLTLHEANSYGNGVAFSHTYPDKSIRTITINGDNITSLVDFDNYITGLDVSCCTELTNLSFFGKLTKLNLSKNTALTGLYINGGNLTSIDVSNNIALTYLYLGDNNLTSIDVSKNIALTYLDLGNNSLTSLDVSKNTALTKLGISSNQLAASALNALFETLHSNAGEKNICTSNNPGTSDCNRSLVTNKGWNVECW